MSLGWKSPIVPAKRHSATSINQDRLTELRDSGVDSDLLLARLDYVEQDGMRKIMQEMAKSPRVYPEMLPTQASGRWSTKKPALVGAVRQFWKRPVIRPDPGEWWDEWDWQGIEARMFTSYTADEEDVELFRIGQDIHTFTCSKYLFGWAPTLEPGQPVDPGLPLDWQGSKDERRTRAKNFRYGVLQYGLDERAILGMPGIEKLGLNKVELLSRAKRFLHARPKALAWKASIMHQCQTDKLARTFMGRRRSLFGKPDDRAKQGLAHMISGSVADLMDWCLIAITRQFPTSSLILNKHDGAIMAFPDNLACESTQEAVRLLVEREWEVGQGITMAFPADWRVTNA